MSVLPLRRLARVSRATGRHSEGVSSSSSCRALFGGTVTALISGLVAAMSTSATFSQEADSAAHGQAVFERYCAACHGNGRGDESDGAVALPGTLALRLKYQGAVPALLEQRTDLSVESIRTFVRNGVASMPPFRPTEVTDEDIAAIAAFLAQDRD